MANPKSRLARAVLSQNLRVRRGENVLIESWSHSLSYARAFVQEARRLGARPTVLYEDEGAWWDSVESRRLASFANLSKVERAAVMAADVYIYFWGPEDRPRQNRLPDRVQNRVTGYNPEWYRVGAKSGLRGCRMTVGQATDPVAHGLGINGPKWRSRLIEAGAYDGRRLLARGTRVAKVIRDGKVVRIRHPNGTDLEIRLAGVHARVDAGQVDAAALKRPFGLLANNPSGQVLVAVDGGDANGTFVSNRTVYLPPLKFAGFKWEISKGRLVKYACKTGGKHFRTEFAAAPEGKDRFGYFSIGLNPKSRDLPPCEDTEEGAIILGIGGNAFAGGRSRIPFQGFAMIGGATIQVDGRTIASAGTLR
jgi:leucyl aminopeptidase (aminopeptidase T)